MADYSSGQRRFRNFADLTEAKKEAATIAEKMSRGEAAALELTNHDRAAYLRALDHLKPIKVPLEVAARNYAEACKILKGDWVIEAAKFYAKRNPTQIHTKTVQEVVDEFLQAKESRRQKAEEDRDLSQRYLQDLRYRCGKFAAAFPCEIASISAAQIEDFLNGLRLSPRSNINFRRVLNTLFEFARRRGCLPQDRDVMAQVEKIRDNGGDIEIYTPEEMKWLLAAADQDFLPTLALGAFAGLRSSEIERLTWLDLNLKDRFIEVKKGKTKTKTRRIVPIVDNLGKWLAPYSGRSGKVWPHGHDDSYDAQQETAERTAKESDKVPPVNWKANALRHSFISYRLADIQNANQVALESGNSVSTIFAHYREWVRPKQAKEWFSICPAEDQRPSIEPVATASRTVSSAN
ncbi:MAG: site-specific integrase [Chloroflexi bacterium]|nr:site-specific integrase [Chloroflexota bacterium]